jgi:hypothetical protein
VVTVLGPAVVRTTVKVLVVLLRVVVSVLGFELAVVVVILSRGMRRSGLRRALVELEETGNCWRAARGRGRQSAL